MCELNVGDKFIIKPESESQFASFYHSNTEIVNALKESRDKFFIVREISSGGMVFADLDGHKCTNKTCHTICFTSLEYGFLKKVESELSWLPVKEFKVGMRVRIKADCKSAFIEQTPVNYQIAAEIESSKDGYAVITENINVHLDPFSFSIDGDDEDGDYAKVLFKREAQYCEYLVEQVKEVSNESPQPTQKARSLSDNELYHLLRVDFGAKDCNRILKIVQDYMR